MSRYLNNTPPPRGSFSYIPSGEANCRVNEIINVEGESFRHPVGFGWTATPLQSPVILETIFGDLEVLSIPSLEELDQPEFPLAGGALAKAPSMTTKAKQLH